MVKKYKERSLMEFQREFASEECCIEHLKYQKWPEGFQCPKCNHKEYWYISTEKAFVCRRCRAKTSLIAGTIFHKTRTPLLKWYWLIYHMAMNKVGVSIFEMQRLLEIKDYKTVWLMAHKIRKAMADRDSGYQVAGLVEMDESFFGPAGHGGKRGRGSETKTTVLCGVSLYTDRKGKEHPGFAHMAIVEDASAESVGKFLERLGSGPGTDEGRNLLEAIRTDKWKSYGKAARLKNLEHCKVILREPKDAGRLLPWVHKLVTNAKSVLRGAHRGVSKKHLQGYLSEICYRFNRRFWERELFDRLVKACVVTETITYHSLIGKKSKQVQCRLSQ